MQHATTFRYRGLGRGSGRGALLAEPSRLESVTAQNGIETSNFHHIPEAAHRSLRAAASLISPMEPSNEFPLLPVTQSSLNIAVAARYSIQVERFEDAGCD